MNDGISPMFFLMVTILMLNDLSAFNLVQAVVVGGAQGLSFIDPEFLNEGPKIGVPPAPF